MDKELSLTSIGLFVLAVFPGLVSTSVYRLIMPARPQEWGSAILQGLFYSTVNFVLSLPMLFLLVFGYDPLRHPVRYCLAAVVVLVLLPMALPLGLVKALRSERLARKIRAPYPTAWDAFFDRTQKCFVLAHLDNGAMIGGYFGSRSIVGSYPNDGDIYLEAVYHVDTAGVIGEPVADTQGVLLRKNDYAFLELFRVPEPVVEVHPAEVVSDG